MGLLRTLKQSKLVLPYTIISVCLIAVMAAAIQWNSNSAVEHSVVKLAEATTAMQVAQFNLQLALDPAFADGGNDGELTAADLANVEVLGRIIPRMTYGLGIVQINIFSTGGRTLYSSDGAMLGQQRGTSGGFQRALQGQVSTALERGAAATDDRREGEGGDIVELYLPLYRNPLSTEGGRAMVGGCWDSFKMSTTRSLSSSSPAQSSWRQPSP